MVVALARKRPQGPFSSHLFSADRPTISHDDDDYNGRAAEKPHSITSLLLFPPSPSLSPLVFPFLFSSFFLKEESKSCVFFFLPLDCLEYEEEEETNQEPDTDVQPTLSLWP